MNLTTYERPPAKSIPGFKPLIANEAIAITRITVEIIYENLRAFTKSNLTFLKALSLIPVEKVSVFFLSCMKVIIRRVRKRALNREVMIPITSVVAKPRIGPDPKT